MVEQFTIPSVRKYMVALTIQALVVLPRAPLSSRFFSNVGYGGIFAAGPLHHNSPPQLIGFLKLCSSDTPQM